MLLNKNNQRENNYLKEYIDTFLNVRFFNYTNEGNPGLARNFGLKKSKGEYILFLDFDDKIKIINLIDTLKKIKGSEDLLILRYFKAHVPNNNLHNKKILKKTIIKNLLKREYDESPNYYLFKKKFLIKNKILFDKGFYEDRIFILKSFYYAKIIKRIKKLIYFKINRKASITNSFSKKHIIDFINSSNQKNYFLKKKIKNKKDILFDELQYGLRGDLNHILKKSAKYRKNFYGNYIKKSYFKILITNFLAKTKIDQKIKQIINNEKV